MTDFTLEDRLRAGLKDAMKARHTPAVTAHRTALAAIANAEAVPVATDHAATEVDRLELTDDDRAAVLRGHVLDRQATIDELRTHGQDDAAAELEIELAALLPYLA